MACSLARPVATSLPARAGGPRAAGGVPRGAPCGPRTPTTARTAARLTDHRRAPRPRRNPDARPSRRRSTTVSVAGRHAVCVSAAATGLRELPIFPLSMVALPAAEVHLNIFEARYRVLFNTLLSGAEGLEDGLVDAESPYCGTREFGMCFVDQNGGLSAIGTLLHIEEHHRYEDGQLRVVNRGIERFKILNVKQERPVLVCDVEFLEREDDLSPELEALSTELADLCKNTLRLSFKVGKVDADETQWNLPELEALTPYELSCWVAFNFLQDNFSKQSMLEIDSTKERLEKLQEWLQQNLSYLSAASALEGAFNKDGDV